jgi:hypothetical protein
MFSVSHNNSAFQASWAIALAADSPVLVVPWQDDAGHVTYVDLRRQPERVLEIPEVHHQPALARALQQLNAADSPWATAKCDCWRLDEEDLEAVAFDLELARDARFGQAGIGSYIDVYSRDVRCFVSLAQHRELLLRLTRTAMRPAGHTGHPVALLEFTLRRCIAEGEDGYAITVFLYAIGQDRVDAQANWDAALDALTGMLRSEGCVG